MFGAFFSQYQWLGEEAFCYPGLDAFLAGEFSRIPAIDLLKKRYGTGACLAGMINRATIQGGIAFEDLPFKKTVSAIASEYLGIDRPLVKFFISASPAAWGLHQDPLDMIVLQLLGSKLWRLSYPIAQRTTETASIVIPQERLQASGQTLHEHLLLQGQMLYLPKDTAHWVSYVPAKTGAEFLPSVHLTIGKHDPGVPPSREEVMVIFHR